MKVFLSYSYKDLPIVKQVAQQLTNRGIDVWFDVCTLSADQFILREVEEAIRLTDFVVLFLSVSSANSSWIRQEYEACKVVQIKNNEDKIRLLSARLDDCDIVPFLSNNLYADFRRSFSLGMTQLLKALLGRKELSPIDQIFDEYARIIEHSSRRLIPSSVLEAMRTRCEEMCTNRRLDCMSSADVLSFGITDKRIRSTLRDYLQFRLQNSIMNYMDENLADISNPPSVPCGGGGRRSRPRNTRRAMKEASTDDVFKAFDYLFNRANEDMLAFRLMEIEGDFSYYTDDVERVLEPLQDLQSIN